jgi:DNA-directed RNA polymerase specialized sigma24 family protein
VVTPPGPRAPQRGAATDGLPRGLRDLADAYGGEIATLAVLVLQHRQDAEAVLDRSLIGAFRARGLPASDPDRRVAVLRIAVRRTLERERRSGTVDPLVIDPVGRRPGAELARPGTGDAIPPAALVAAMAMLPARQRALIALRHALDLDVAQVAAVMGGRAARVGAQLGDARDRLRGALDASGPLALIEEISDVD